MAGSVLFYSTLYVLFMLFVECALGLLFSNVDGVMAKLRCVILQVFVNAKTNASRNCRGTRAKHRILFYI